MELGWDVHLWDCIPAARIMPSAKTYWAGFTKLGYKENPNNPNACVWSREWKNPYPSIAIENISIVTTGTEATVVCLGITAVEQKE